MALGLEWGFLHAKLMPLPSEPSLWPSAYFWLLKNLDTAEFGGHKPVCEHGPHLPISQQGHL